MDAEDQEIVDKTKKIIADLQAGVDLMEKPDRIGEGVMLIGLVLDGKEIKAVKKNIKQNWG